MLHAESLNPAFFQVATGWLPSSRNRHDDPAGTRSAETSASPTVIVTAAVPDCRVPSLARWVNVSVPWESAFGA